MSAATISGLGLIGACLLCFGWTAGWFAATHYLTDRPYIIQLRRLRRENRRIHRQNKPHLGPPI